MACLLQVSTSHYSAMLCTPVRLALGIRTMLVARESINCDSPEGFLISMSVIGWYV